MAGGVSQLINRGHVDISSLKLWATRYLPSTSPLRNMILLEPDKIPIETFLVKIDTWLKLGDLDNT